MKKKTILIATHNRAKFAEIVHNIKNLPYDCVSLSDTGISYEVDETGTTFEENAILKAQQYSNLSGLLTLADDGGLMVDALHGEPGVYSSRYAGVNASDEEKIAFLLEKMKNVPLGQRKARFSCVIALAGPYGLIKTYEGSCSGHITLSAQGAVIKGFPYCRILALDGYGKTLAELTEQKIAYQAHRQIALEKLIHDLSGL